MTALATYSYHAQTLPIASSVRGRMLRKGECNAQYLWDNARQPVRFSDALTALLHDGPVTLVEIGPSASFAGNVRDMARLEGRALDHFAPATLPETALDAPQGATLHAWLQGLTVDVSSLVGPARDAPPPPLPSYPWDEARHYLEITPDALDTWGERSSRRLVGLRAERAGSVWTRTFSPTAPEWIADHMVGARLLLPATALTEMMLDAGHDFWPDAGLELRDVQISAAVQIEGDGVRLRTHLDTDTGQVTISQRPRLVDSGWSVVARGQIRALDAPRPNTRLRPPKSPRRDARDLYARLASQGLTYGPAFRRLEATRAFGKNGLWMALSPASAERFLLDPRAFDAGLHGLAQWAFTHSTGTAASLKNLVAIPVGMARLQLFAPGAAPHAARLRVTRQRALSIVVELALFDAENRIIAQAEGIELVGVNPRSHTGPNRQLASRRPCRLRLRAQPLPPIWNSPQRLAKTLGFAAHSIPPTALTLALDQLRADLMRGPSTSPKDDLFTPFLPHNPQLAQDLRALMAQARGEAFHDLWPSCASQIALWARAEVMLRKITRLWPKDARLNLHLAGLPPHALLRWLRAQPQIDRLSLSLGTSENPRALRQHLPPDLRGLITQRPVAGSVDLALSLDVTAMEAPCLAPGGVNLHLWARGFNAPPPISAPIAERQEGAFTFALTLARADTQSVPETVSDAPALTLYDVAPAPEGAVPPRLSAWVVPIDPRAKPVAGAYRLLHLDRGFESATQGLKDAFRALQPHLQPDPLPLLVLYQPPLWDAAAQALAAGLASVLRTATNEVSEGRFALITLIGPDVPAPWDWPAAIAAAFDEGAITLHVTGETLRATTEVYEPCAPLPPEGARFRLSQSETGRFDALAWRAPPRAEPLAPDAVEIAVEACALNYRDVMAARGLLPERILDQGASDAPLGMECLGTLRRLGADVEGLEIGQRVMALAPGALASRVVTTASAVMAAPDDLSAAQGAALPVAFLTAWHALVTLARVGPQDRVLIHGGAGGVGLAAIQIAKLFGAEVYATASTEAKRHVARAYGADHLFHSRDHSFVAGVAKASQGRGATIVLNSLSGDLMRRSLETLGPFGTFIELGKRDYIEGSQIALSPFLRNLSYHGVDLDQYVARYGDRARACLREIADHLATGRLKPLPVSLFTSDETPRAFQHMLTSQHVGKVVLTPPAPRRPPPPAAVAGDWMILGGHGGIGLRLADRLLRLGATRVHLLSRSGDISDDTRAQAPAGLLENPRLRASALDGRDAGALATYFAQIEAEGGTLAGVIHAAMFLRDRRLDALDLHEAGLVIDAKLGVAEALDQALRAREAQPAHVIFLSSIAAWVGNVGQAAYSAANAAMEALVTARRHDGLAARSFGWGPIAGAGYITRQNIMTAQISRQSAIALLDIEAMLDQFEAGLRRPAPQDWLCASVDWAEMARYLPALHRAPFHALVGDGADRRPPQGALIDTLRHLPWAAAVDRIEGEIRTIFAEILRVEPAAFDMNRPLNSQGLDSLMAMEMRLELEKRFAGEMPNITLTPELTAARLASVLLKTLRSDEGEPPSTPETAALPSPQKDVGSS